MRPLGLNDYILLCFPAICQYVFYLIYFPGNFAAVVELADAPDSKSGGVNPRAGSTPASGSILRAQVAELADFSAEDGCTSPDSM